MKAFLISDHAKWCALMMNGKKTIEVRKGTALYKATKKLIDEYGFAEFYVYCTKSNYFGYISKRYIGKVLFKFRCYKVEEIKKFPLSFKDYNLYRTSTLDFDDFEKKSCLNKEELNDYLQGKTSTAIHISDLEIFDRPKELSEFKRYGGLEYAMKNADNPLVDDNWNEIVYLTKAPQSFMFIESEK